MTARVRCAECGRPVVQLPRGRPRVVCRRPACRRLRCNRLRRVYRRKK